jgi:predicted protein tyrosine phosphatase
LPNLLFICSKNQWRSPTAELLFKNNARHKARSAGTSAKARIKVNAKMIAWADVIFVMERKHLQILKQLFPEAIAGKPITILDIEDNYRFGDEELIAILKTLLTDYL